MLSLKNFEAMFPYHLCLDKNMTIVHCGVFMQKEFNLPCKDSSEILFHDIFSIINPAVGEVSYENFAQNLHETVIVSAKNNMNRSVHRICKNLVLKGQIHLINNGENLLYLCTPFIASPKELRQHNLYIADFSLHDTTRELIMLNQSRECQIHVNEQLEESMEKKRTMTSKLRFQKERNLNLLNEFLPPSIVLKRLEEESEFAETFDESTCLIASVAFFDVILVNCPAKEIFEIVTDLFKVFDHLVDVHQCHKVVSRLDTYYVISGVPEKAKNHAARILNLAIAFLAESKKIIVPSLGIPIMINMAIHTGSVMAGLIGKMKMRYCVLGEGFDVPKHLTRNEEMPGQIMVTNSIKQAVQKFKNDEFMFSINGYKKISKNTATCTYLLEKNLKKSVWEITDHAPDPDTSSDGYAELFENSLSEWMNLEKNVDCQRTVIALLKNKPIPVNSWALKRLKWAQKSKNLEKDKSTDSGVHSGTSNAFSVDEQTPPEDRTSPHVSRACTIM